MEVFNSLDISTYQALSKESMPNISLNSHNLLGKKTNNALSSRGASIQM